MKELPPLQRKSGYSIILIDRIPVPGACISMGQAASGGYTGVWAGYRAGAKGAPLCGNM